ncbi:hypothetical protein ALI22I_02635 [Saccharothrix sp. ALI-22-I]|uniref:hypothetical protein n=1 Tax=Saccharothrix sp. ALI-22-I TaxID=1933778 RepID=UPI00097C0711|nr:hypothetical protein [Saccharothrix sp. ALI-22-I]ONI92657.1 hypothetical protein ALI22I_02635 [Saccharothrix sp. ALI-22-I]
MTSDDEQGESGLTTPNGCRWCGLGEREHYRRWKPPVGWHHWTPPTDDQRKERMQARRRHVEGPHDVDDRYLLCG